MFFQVFFSCYSRMTAIKMQLPSVRSPWFSFCACSPRFLKPSPSYWLLLYLCWPQSSVLFVMSLRCLYCGDSAVNQTHSPLHQPAPSSLAELHEILKNTKKKKTCFGSQWPLVKETQEAMLAYVQGYISVCVSVSVGHKKGTIWRWKERHVTFLCLEIRKKPLFFASLSLVWRISLIGQKQGKCCAPYLFEPKPVH